MKYRFLLLLLKGLGRLPLSVGRALGAALGWCLYRRAKSRSARVTRINLALCFPRMPPEDRERLARQSLMETGKLAAEIAAVWSRPVAWLDRHIQAEEGAALITEKLARTRGLILLTPHLGNWEVIGPWGARFAPFTALYQPAKHPAIDTFMAAGRLKPNVSLAPTNRQGVGQLLKALRCGEIVCILPDQVPDTGSGMVAPFFGEPALTMTLVHSLMKCTGCEVVMSYCERVRGGFKVVVTECDPEIYADDPAVAVAALNRSVEACARRVPSQYQWEYKRFRARPGGEPY